MAKIDTNNGMGLVRYILALAVVMAHFNSISGAGYYFPISSYHAVGGFFALSGFLVYGSYQRSGNLRYFIKRRAVKILPPYLTVVTACALFLGFTVTPHDWSSYFSADWFKYLGANLTFLNFLHPTLPGVFDGEPVNGSLWTIKIEWLLYLSVPVVILAIRKLKVRNEYKFFIALYLISALYRMGFLWLFDLKGLQIFYIMSRQVFGQLCYFYTGVMVFRYYDLFKRNIPLFLTIAIVMIGISQANMWVGIIFEPFGVSVLTIGVSMLLGGWLKIFNKNNASYEMYLFHLPIVHLVWQYRDSLNVTTFRAFMLSVCLVVAASFMCWFILDKPLLRQRH